MEKVVSGTQGSLCIALFAAEAGIKACPFGVTRKMTMKAYWKGKTVEYQPGRLVAAIKKTTNVEAAQKLVEQVNGSIDYIGRDGVLDIIVPERTTINAAAKLIESGAFRFVDPLIIERRKNY